MSLPTDDRFKDQWHLLNTVVGEYDLDVVAVWDDYTGKGIKVAVTDGGIDYNNPDLKPNFDLKHSYDEADQDSDPAPKDILQDGQVIEYDNHGTAVAGIIGASANNGGVVGVAYGATLMGYRMGAETFSYEAIEAALAAAEKNGADVINMSWGDNYNFPPLNDGDRKVQAAMVHMAAEGRGGLGTILVKAAGNSRDILGASNVDAFAPAQNETHTIQVAAIDRNGLVSTYSSPGATILVSAFGTPGEVVTTDRVGAAGANIDPNDPGVMTSFNGTSAAAPMVSGIAALMLEANAALGWRDVQTILAYTARQVGTEVGAPQNDAYEQNPWAFNSAANWNGGRLHFSADYGYGLVDARAAVRLAETWTTASTSANEAVRTVSLLDSKTYVTIPDADPAGETFSFKNSLAIDVERVVVKIDFAAVDSKDLAVYLIAPDGAKYALIDGLPVGDNDPFNPVPSTVYLGDGPYEFATQGLRGQSAQGTWKVQLVDMAANGSRPPANSAIEVKSIDLSIYGAKSSTSDSYYYTDEFSDYAGKFKHSTTLKDTDGGTDTLNAAAVSTAMTIDLLKRTGKIDGVSMKMNGIENVFGGDGNDQLLGNASANRLSGGRGLDKMTGGAGSDTFVFHIVKDSLAGSKRDVITDFSAGDRIDLSDIDAASSAGDQAFRFLGDKALDGKSSALDFHIYNKPGTANDVTLVSADLDRDKHPDFQIALSGLHTLVKTDFIL